jgi:hypothetical protein
VNAAWCEERSGAERSGEERRAKVNCALSPRIRQSTTILAFVYVTFLRGNNVLYSTLCTGRREEGGGMRGRWWRWRSITGTW